MAPDIEHLRTTSSMGKTGEPTRSQVAQSIPSLWMLILQQQRSVYYIIHNHICLHVQHLKIISLVAVYSWRWLIHLRDITVVTLNGLPGEGWKVTVLAKLAMVPVFERKPHVEKLQQFQQSVSHDLMSSHGLTHKQTNTQPCTCLNINHCPYHTFQPWSNLQNKPYILRRSVPHLPLIDKEVTGNITHVS